MFDVQCSSRILLEIVQQWIADGGTAAGDLEGRAVSRPVENPRAQRDVVVKKDLHHAVADKDLHLDRFALGKRTVLFVERAAAGFGLADGHSSARASRATR